MSSSGSSGSSRRGFLKTAAGIVAAGVVAGVGGYVAGASTGQSATQGTQAINRTVTQTTTQTVVSSSKPLLDKLRIGYIPIISGTPLMVAMEKGFFEAEGLPTPEPKIVGGSGVTIEALLSKSVEVGHTAYPAAITLGAERGIFVKIIHPLNWFVKGVNGPALTVTSDSNIKSLKDLQGKKIATPVLGSPDQIAVLILMKKAGFDVSTVQWVEIPYPKMLEVLLAKQIDVASMVQPFRLFGEEKGTIRPLIDSPILPDSNYLMAAFGEPFPVSGAFVTEEFATSNPEAGRRIVAAISRAIGWINNNPQDAAAILSKWTKTDISVTQKLMLKAEVYYPYPSGFSDTQALKPQYDGLLQFGYVKKSVDLTKLVDEPWIKTG